MPRKKISESLAVRVFLITASLLLFAGAITFGFIAWAAPSTYTAVMNDDLAAQVDVLVERLADTAPEDCGRSETAVCERSACVRARRSACDGCGIRDRF